MIDWILGHLGLVVVIIAGLASMFGRKKSAGGDEGAGAPTEGRAFQTSADADDAERARRVQEEIRKKIAERRGGAVPPQTPWATPERPVASREVAPRPVAGDFTQVLRERMQAKLDEVQAREEAASKARARRHAEERNEQEAVEQSFLSPAAEIHAAEKSAAAALKHPVPQHGIAERSFLDDFRSPSSLRRAVVLREVLGAPVAMR